MFMHSILLNRNSKCRISIIKKVISVILVLAVEFTAFSFTIDGCYYNISHTFNKKTRKIGAFGGSGSIFIVSGIMINSVPVIGQIMSIPLFIGGTSIYLLTAKQTKDFLKIKNTKQLIEEAYLLEKHYMKDKRLTQNYPSIEGVINNINKDYFPPNNKKNENMYILSKIILSANNNFDICHLKLNLNSSKDRYNSFRLKDHKNYLPSNVFSVQKITSNINTGLYDHYRLSAIQNLSKKII